MILNKPINFIDKYFKLITVPECNLNSSLVKD